MMLMENVKTGKEKQLAYTYEYSQYKKAMKQEFYLEAVAIGYAIIEDRLTAFLHHAGIVTRANDELKINKSVYPYIRKLLDKDDKYSVKIKDLSIKIRLIRALLDMTEEQSKQIDQYVENYVSNLKRKRTIVKIGFMHDLYIELKKINKKIITDVFDKIEPWRISRNQLIHALLNKKINSTKNAKKECAEKAYEITREIDNCLVKPFKKGNKIRKKYNIH